MPMHSKSAERSNKMNKKNVLITINNNLIISLCNSMALREICIYGTYYVAANLLEYYLEQQRQLHT